MLKELLCACAVSVMLASPSFAMAKDSCGGDCTSCHSLSLKEAGDLIRKTGVNVKSVKQSPARGLHELLVEKDGKQGILFVDYGKKHIIQGAVFSADSLRPAIAHEKELPQPKEVSFIDPATIPAHHAVVMGNPKASKKLFVFTDPDCPYCRKAHLELVKLASMTTDLAIHIMLYPLPMHPAAFDKSRTILESRKLDLLDKAFEGKELPKPSKDSSRTAVEAIVSFANANGISGTPTMVLPDGRVQVGLPDAETLKKMLEGK